MFKRFGAGFAVGYVLGARAGEKRYKEIRKLGEKVLDLPAVRQLTEAKDGSWADTARQLRDEVVQRLSELVSRDEDDQDSDADTEDDEEDEGVEDEDAQDRSAADDEDEDGEGDEDEAEDGGKPRASSKSRQHDDERPRRRTSRPQPEPEHEKKPIVSTVTKLASAARERGRVA